MPVAYEVMSAQLTPGRDTGAKRRSVSTRLKSEMGKTSLGIRTKGYLSTANLMPAQLTPGRDTGAKRRSVSTRLKSEMGKSLLGIRTKGYLSTAKLMPELLTLGRYKECLHGLFTKRVFK